VKYKLKEDYSGDYDINYLLERLSAFCNRLKPLLPEDLYYRLFSTPKCSVSPDDYCYRELCHTYMQDGERKWSKWDRVKSKDVIKYIREYPNSEVYYTVQKFRFPQKVNNEDFIMPLFFDFDSESLLDALIDCQLVVDMFLNMGLSDKLIQVSFSGNKGFHIIIDEKVFGFTSCQDMHKKVEHIHKKLVHELNLKTLCPSTGNRKMLRIQNTINLKSGLYKITLKASDINKLESGEEYLEKILILAKQPQKSIKNDKPILVESAKSWAIEMLKDYQPQKFSRVTAKKIDFIPVCIQDLIANNIQAEGMRNKATMILAEYYKDAGATEKETTELVTNWVKNIPTNLTSSHGNNLMTLTVSAIKAVYNSGNYHFDCSFIKSLPWKIKCSKGCKLNEK